MQPLRRFWRDVSVQHVEGSYTLLLDGKLLKTPAGKPYAAHTQELAHALAAEWNAVDGVIKPEQMPVTQVLATAIDHFPAKRADVVAQLIAYGQTDLLCHRADKPEGLRLRQDKFWQPVLDALAQQRNIVLHPVYGIQAAKPEAASLRLIQIELEGLSDVKLVAMQVVVSGLGSIALGLALSHRLMDFEMAWRASELEAEYQAEKWGRDDEAEAARRIKHAELAAIAKLLIA